MKRLYLAVLLGLLVTGPVAAEDAAWQGKTVLVTGANRGLGLEFARQLHAAGATVIGTGRTMEKAQRACDSVGGETIPAVLELTDFDSVVACADAVEEHLDGRRPDGGTGRAANRAAEPRAERDLCERRRPDLPGTGLRLRPGREDG